MPRRTRRQADYDDALGITALVIGALIYRSLGALTVPWKIALVVLVTSLSATAIVWFVRAARRRRVQRLMLTDALNLTPAQFEERIRDLLQDLGWERVQWVGGSGDGGVDLRGIYRGQRYIVQCKRYRGRVAPHHLRELDGTRAHERADRALLVTTGRFTRQGYAWVRGKPIDLWDGTVLAHRCAEQDQRRQDPALRQHARSRTRWMLGSLAALNALVLGWATVSGPVFVPVERLATTTTSAPTAPSSAPAEQPVTARQPDAPLDCGQATISGVARLVLRSAPGLQSEKIADYPAGTVVTLGCSDPVDADGLIWQPVQVDDRDGWMSARMLQGTE
jgi:restriction system protein